MVLFAWRCSQPQLRYPRRARWRRRRRTSPAGATAKTVYCLQAGELKTGAFVGAYLQTGTGTWEERLKAGGLGATAPSRYRKVFQMAARNIVREGPEKQPGAIVSGVVTSVAARGRVGRPCNRPGARPAAVNDAAHHTRKLCSRVASAKSNGAEPCTRIIILSTTSNAGPPPWRRSLGG